jgi:hypothetical protein
VSKTMSVLVVKTSLNSKDSGKMVDYKVVKDKEQYKIIESTTGHVVNTAITEQDARKFARTWNLGGGFAGWTPAFFLEKNVFSVDFTPETD